MHKQLFAVAMLCLGSINLICPGKKNILVKRGGVYPWYRDRIIFSYGTAELQSDDRILFDFEVTGVGVQFYMEKFRHCGFDRLFLYFAKVSNGFDPGTLRFGSHDSFERIRDDFVVDCIKRRSGFDTQVGGLKVSIGSKEYVEGTLSSDEDSSEDEVAIGPCPEEMKR